MRGGEDPCVTDANIVLGKLNSKKILGGRMDVDIELAKKPMKAAAMTPAEGPDRAVLMGQSMVSLMEMMEPLDWVT